MESNAVSAIATDRNYRTCNSLDEISLVSTRLGDFLLKLRYRVEFNFVASTLSECLLCVLVSLSKLADIWDSLRKLDPKLQRDFLCSSIIP